jgi:cytochrome oxidase Cu insertion factor (SCO1/SenC/PrrC family)
MIRKIFLAFLVFAAAVSSLLITSPALAATPPANSQGLNVEISPLPIELNAKPGTSVSTEQRYGQ